MTGSGKNNMDALTISELLAAIVLIGGALGVIIRYISPAVKIGDRVASLERHEKDNRKMIEENELSNRLLCKAMIALIDNKLTNNNDDGLKNVKSELMDFITKG